MKRQPSAGAFRPALGGRATVEQAALGQDESPASAVYAGAAHAKLAPNLECAPGMVGVDVFAFLL
jgi:hypothetical protein